MGCTPPWPYKATGNKTIEVTPEDREAAREILERLRHEGVWQVAQDVPLSPSTLARMTTRSRLMFFAARRELDDGSVVTCQWEPIITEEEMITLRKASAGRLPCRRTGHDKRCNRFKVKVGQRQECRNQSLIKCSEIDEPLLLHAQNTLDRVAEIRKEFEQAIREESGNGRADAIRLRLAEAEAGRDRLVDSITSGVLTAAEAKKHLRNIRDEIADLHLQLQLAEADSPVQLALLEKFQGIKLAEYSLEEQRELLRIAVRDIRLRFDRMFITYNLYEAPGKLYVGEVKVPRRPTHNSKLRQK